MKRKLALITDENKTAALFSLLLTAISNTELINHSSSIVTFLKRKIKYLNCLIIDVESEEFKAGQIRIVKDRYPRLNILVIYDVLVDKEVHELLKSGADGFLQRKCFSSLHVAVSSLMEGGSFLSPEVARMVVANFWTEPDTIISRREREVLQLLAKGKNCREISEVLEISKDTSKVHIRNIYTKLNVNKRDEALSKAREGKIIVL
jgi:DNA-binding NarL/FixJ family response regulator